MKALILTKNEHISHPSEVQMILNYIERHEMTLSISKKILEIMWYAFSEIYEANFLTPYDDLLSEFTKMLSKVDVEAAESSDAYGVCANGKSVWSGCGLYSDDEGMMTNDRF